MEIVLCLVLVAVCVEGRFNPLKVEHDDGFRVGDYTKVVCTSEFNNRRDHVMQKAKCGEPKDVFTQLKPKTTHEVIHPGSVWVKQCVGICEFENDGSCVATATKIKHVPVRIYNSETNKESCATYAVEEHVSCGCCNLSPEHCISPRVFNPRKCSCHCPNIEDRRECIKKTNMTWDRAQCACKNSA